MMRRIGLAAAALTSLCLGGCIFGGTGSDTENGVDRSDQKKTDTFEIKGVTARVVDAEGKPLAMVNVFLFAPEYRPDTGDAQVSVMADTAKPPVTDSLGYVSLSLKAPGKFVVEGVLAGQTLFFDTLAAPDIKVATPFTFRVRATAAFAGKVKLASGMRIDSGTVFIRGTSRKARIDAAGNYHLGSLPADVARMAVGIRYAASPTSVQESKQVVIGTVSMTPTYACKDVPKDSTARITAMSGKASTSVIADSIPARSKEDSSKLNTALKACDSLPTGSVVNVVSRNPAVPGQPNDSTAVPVLVLVDEKPVSSMFGEKLTPAQVIPYAECVPSAGRETTSYDLQLLPAGGNNDLLIKDVAAKCLDK
ncbi:MAG: hypothetical protein ABIW76_06455 [Fibrobacteria bacterium]